MKNLWFMIIFITGLISNSLASEGDRTKIAAQTLIQAQNAGTPIPILSATTPEMDIPMAYAIQKSYAEAVLSNSAPFGFKAGLTSPKGQAKFNLTAPVAGVLFLSGKHENQARINSQKFGRPMIETEIGFILGRGISRPIKDIGELKPLVASIVPVVELPDLGFENMNALGGKDIIAANVASRQFIMGRPIAAGTIDPDTIRVTLTREEAVVNTGKGSDALGSQWQALLWLTNTTIENGWGLEPGQLLITGALGKMIPGKPGEYTADYGDFGKIRFKIR